VRRPREDRRPRGPVGGGKGYLATLREHGTTEPFHDHMLDFAGIDAIVGTDDLLEFGRRYDQENRSMIDRDPRP
jgi:hypothetical protein